MPEMKKKSETEPGYLREDNDRMHIIHQQVI